MADRSAIEWTDASWTPIRARRWEIQDDGSGKERIGWHCEHVSEGCRNCYAERINLRLGTGYEFKPGVLRGRPGYYGGGIENPELFLDEEMLLAPLRWKKPRMIFVCSMTDLFADFVTDEWRDKMFAVMALCPQHTFQVLTKRAENLHHYMSEHVKGPWAGRATRIEDDGTSHPEWDVAFRMRSRVCDLLPVAPADALNRACKFMDDRDGGEGDGFLRRWPLPNVWLGVSAERQQEWDERTEHLKNTPAAVRFVSVEPMLGPIYTRFIRKPVDADYRGWDGDGPIDRMITKLADEIHWIICGGESGPHARPMHPDWARSLRDQCQAAGVSFFFKQWGEWKAHKVVPGGDLGGDVRAGRVRVVHPTGQSDVEVFEATGGRNTIPGTRYVARVGKKAAGRLLDGVEHNGFPERAA